MKKKAKGPAPRIRLVPVICGSCGLRSMGAAPATLRAAREHAGASLSDVGKEIGLSIGYLSDVERGRRNTTDRIVRYYSRTFGKGGKELVRKSA